MNVYFQGVRSLLRRVGVESELITRPVDVRLAVASGAAFADSVGMRYCRQKQHRVEAAASFYRYKALLLAQRRTLVEHAVASRRSNGASAKVAIDAAVATLRAQHQHVRAEAIPADCTVVRGEMLALDLHVSPLRFFEQINAQQFFDADESRATTSAATFELPLVAVHAAAAIARCLTSRCRSTCRFWRAALRRTTASRSPCTATSIRRRCRSA
jgi:hypothetical protein